MAYENAIRKIGVHIWRQLYVYITTFLSMACAKIFTTFNDAHYGQQVSEIKTLLKIKNQNLISR